MCPRCAAPHNPPGRGGGRAREVRLPGRTSLTRSLKYPCDILPSGLFFENQRQRVGCVRLLTLKGVLSIAVEFERALLTAEQSRNSILKLSCFSCKLNPRPSGGVS